MQADDFGVLKNEYLNILVNKALYRVITLVGGKSSEFLTFGFGSYPSVSYGLYNIEMAKTFYLIYTLEKLS